MEEQEGRREEYSEEDVQLLFRAVGKMHKACLRKEMDRRGLAEVGQPFILFMLRDQGGSAGWDQKQFAEALGVSPRRWPFPSSAWNGRSLSRACRTLRTCAAIGLLSLKGT